MNESVSYTVLYVTEDSLAVHSVDSVVPEIEEPVVTLFTDHLLGVESAEPLARLEIHAELVFVIFTICAVLIVYLQRNSDGIFSSIFKSSFDSNLASQEARVDNTQRTRNMLLLQIVSAISISTFVGGALIWTNQIEGAFTQLFLQILGGLVVFVILKRGVQWVLANLFQLGQMLKGYHFNVNVLWSVAGLIVLPLSLLLFYSPFIPIVYPVILGVVVFGFFYLKILQRGVQIVLSSGSVSPLHLFYYFCALEMLPVFVLIRLAFEL